MILGGNLSYHNAISGNIFGRGWQSVPPASSRLSPLGSSALVGLGLGVQGVGAALGIANFGVGLYSSMEQIKQAKQMAKLARDQFTEENRRYYAREAERQEANKSIAQSADAYQPMVRL
ncbi:hypothetical protein ACFOPX_05010 [Helicobacter baculiformis]|uniref:Uncharacterized protein n=1 Tax=Helicobacter baculiformis TaxID=427351 RepID=A0ABV7ZL36_9HELI|nr:hypothetical protein [Helicobacter baculiformis]